MREKKQVKLAGFYFLKQRCTLNKKKEKKKDWPWEIVMVTHPAT